jgi:hypothetical protein
MSAEASKLFDTTLAGSSLGDLASAAISNAYNPASNRRAGLVFGKFLLGTGQQAAANLAQEFILRRITSKAKNQN